MAKWCTLLSVVSSTVGRLNNWRLWTLEAWTSEMSSWKSIFRAYHQINSGIHVEHSQGNAGQKGRISRMATLQGLRWNWPQRLSRQSRCADNGMVCFPYLNSLHTYRLYIQMLGCATSTATRSPTIVMVLFSVPLWDRLSIRLQVLDYSYTGIDLSGSHSRCANRISVPTRR